MRPDPVAGRLAGAPVLTSSVFSTRNSLADAPVAKAYACRGKANLVDQLPGGVPAPLVLLSMMIERTQSRPYATTSLSHYERPELAREPTVNEQRWGRASL